MADSNQGGDGGGSAPKVCRDASGKVIPCTEDQERITFPPITDGGDPVTPGPDETSPLIIALGALSLGIGIGIVIANTKSIMDLRHR